jgi:hypothetical protein
VRGRAGAPSQSALALPCAVPYSHLSGRKHVPVPSGLTVAVGATRSRNQRGAKFTLARLPTSLDVTGKARARWGIDTKGLGC